MQNKYDKLLKNCKLSNKKLLWRDGSQITGKQNMAAAAGIDGDIDPKKIVRVFGDKFSSVTGSGQMSLDTPSSAEGAQTSLFSITDA